MLDVRLIGRGLQKPGKTKGGLAAAASEQDSRRAISSRSASECSDAQLNGSILFLLWSTPPDADLHIRIFGTKSQA